MAQYKNFDTYISQDHHLNVKESFKKLGQMISPDKETRNTFKVLDVGCATGALVGYLKGCYPKWKYTGIDISAELLNVAKKKLPSCEWIQGSAINISKEFENSFDLIVCFGVLGIFNESDAIKLFDNLLRCIRPGGQIILFSQFNEMDVDTQISHRKYDKNGHDNGWESGWNNYSVKTITKWLNSRVSKMEFVDFVMPYDIEAKNDLVRSWTVQVDQQRRLTNGLKLLIDLKFFKNYGLNCL